MEEMIILLSLLGKIFLGIGIIVTVIHIIENLFEIIQDAFRKTEEKKNRWKLDLNTIPFLLIGIFGALILLIT